MNKTKIGIFLSLLLLIGLTSCGEQKSNNKLVLNCCMLTVKLLCLRLRLHCVNPTVVLTS